MALVSVVFTDLVDSTSTAVALGDRAADDLRREHFASLREAVAATGGTEVKTIGDSLMVTYEGAAEAVEGAVAMQRAVDRQNRRSAHPLVMRVGLSAGDATFEDGDWFGTPVVEAARLCASASGGQILTTELLKGLAGARADHEFRAVGARELKGLPEPVPAYEIGWEVAGELMTVPLPPLLEGEIYWDGSALTTPADHALGMVSFARGRYDDVDRHLATAVAVCRERQVDVHLSRVTVDWARTFLLRGETTRARELAESVMTMTEGLDMSGPSGARRRAERVLDGELD